MPSDAGDLRFGMVTTMRPQVTPRQLFVGSHGLEIGSVAVGDGAAVSIDSGGYARLWPSLDGEREPWVLPLSQPAQVAVERAPSGSGFAVASRDDAGNLELLTVDDGGMLTSHVQFGSELAHDAPVAIGDGFLTVRSDQVLEWIDASGVLRRTLPALPGEHVERILTHAAHALVLVTGHDGMHGRWLDPAGDSLAWGEATPSLPIAAGPVILAPDLEHVVGLEALERVVVELRTAKTRVIANPTSGVGPAGVPLGFVSEHQVAFGDKDLELSSLEWWDLTQNKRVGHTNEAHQLQFVPVQAASVSEGRVVAFAQHDLVIASPTRINFLGYRHIRATGVRPTPNGLVADVGTHALLDERLRVDRRLSRETVTVDGELVLIRLDSVGMAIDQDWLEIKPQGRYLRPRIALYDTAHSRELQSWPVGIDERRFWYEPSTRLMAIDRGKRLVTASYDPNARAFGAAHTIAMPTIRDVALLDATLAGGSIAVTIHTSEARTWHDFTQPPVVLALAGAIEAIDRAGHIYVRETPGVVVAYAGDRERARYEHVAGWTLRPSPDGARVAAFAKDRVMLLDAAGNELWTAVVYGVDDLEWTPHGELVAAASDLAQLSLDDGRVSYAQCGWRFGSHATRAMEISFRSTTCDR